MLAVEIPDTSFSKDRKLSSVPNSFPFWSIAFTPVSVRPQAWSTLGSPLVPALGSTAFLGGRRITWTFEPPNPKEFTPTIPPRTGIGLSTTWTRPSRRAGMSGFGLLKCRLGAQTPLSKESNTCVQRFEMNYNPCPFHQSMTKILERMTLRKSFTCKNQTVLTAIVLPVKRYFRWKRAI